MKYKPKAASYLARIGRLLLAAIMTLSLTLLSAEPSMVLAAGEEVNFTFNGFDQFVADKATQVSITVQVNVIGDIAADTTPLRYRSTLTNGSGDPISGQEILYPDAGDDPEDTGTWSSFVTDGNGQAFFGPGSGFTLNQVPALTGLGQATPFLTTLGAGEYLLTVELLDWSDSENPTTLGDPGSHTFVVPLVVDGSCADGDSNNECDDGHTYKTIQAAVNAASRSTGWTIQVAAGTYAGNVTFPNNATSPEDLTLIGPNAGIPGWSTGRVAEAVIQGSVLPINQGRGITIDGFRIETEGGYGVHANQPANVKNNVIVGNGTSSGIFSGGTRELVVEASLIQGFGSAIALDGGPGSVASTFENNRITGNGTGFSTQGGLFVSSGHVIKGNVIEENSGTGISLGGRDINSTVVDPSFVVENNIIRNNGGIGISTGWAATHSPADLVITGNAIYGSPVLLRNRFTGGDVLNVSANWFGSNDPDTVEALMEGDVDFTPFLASDTDADADPSNGFQGDFSNLIVHALGEQTDATGRVQEGIDLVSSSTVNVAAGTYNEDVTIDKSVTLNGAQAGIDARNRTGSESEIVGVIEVTSAAASFVFDGFKSTSPTRDFSPRGFNLHSEADDSTIRNNIFVSEENAGHTPYGSSLDFTNISNATVEKNAFSGHLDTVQEPNLIAVNGASGVVAVQHNEMHDVGGGGGIALISDITEANIQSNLIDNTGEGIFHFGGTLGSLRVFGNTLENSEKNGILLAGTVLNSIIDFNSFEGNNGGIQNSTSSQVDARNNWWGDASGPSGEGPGTGDSISTNVLFDPWLGAETDDVASKTVGGDGEVSTSEGSISATYNSGSGSATVTVAEYTGNPGADSNAIGTAGAYFDINLSNNTDPNATLTVDFNFGNPDIEGDPLYWFNGTDWIPVTDNSGIVPLADSAGNYVGVVFGPSSNPSLSELGGTAITSGANDVRVVDTNGDSTGTIAEGETIQLVVEADSPALYGVDVSLTFDPVLVEVTGVSLGGDLDADTIARNDVDNGNGTLRFAFSQASPDGNVAGNNMALATITFLARDAVTSPEPLDVAIDTDATSLQFTDKDGTGVVPNADGDFILTINPSPLVFADVTLQGRTDHSGISLEMEPTETGNVLFDSDGSTSAGHLEISPVPSAEYSIRVHAPKYLAAEKTETVPDDVDAYDLTPDPLELRGGDINGDDRINIQDLVLIGANFGTSTASVDINGDGTVNIQDLAIAAGNFGLTTDAAYTW